MYPLISYNNKQLCEQRWEDDAHINDDVGTEWEISIGNGKRLRQKWKRKGGIAYVANRYGETQTIYNKVYDVEWQRALNNDELRPPQGLTRQVAMDLYIMMMNDEMRPPQGLTRQVAMDLDYDRPFQPDGDDDFYNNLQH